MTHSSRFRRLTGTGLKVLLLTGIMFVLFSTAYSLTGVASDPSLASPEAEASETGTADPEQENTGAAPPSSVSTVDQSRMALIVLSVCFLQALAVSIAVLRSRSTGWRLMLAIFAVLFIGSAIVSHIDSLFFMRDLSRALIGKMVLANLLISAVFSAAAVWILGRARGNGQQPAPSELEHHSQGQWVLVFLALTALHVILYFVFGYYVAWQSPEVRAFYGGEDPGSFWLQMVSVAKGSPLLIPVQVLRGLLWALMAVILTSTLAGSRWSVALITAGFFIAVFCMPLLFPNPLMPDAVRQAHLVETVLSRGLFGFFAVWFVRSPLHLRHTEPSLA